MKESKESEQPEAIKLYRCKDCTKFRSFERIQKGETTCPKCGSAHVKYAPATLRYAIPYAFSRDDWSLFRKIKELVTFKVASASN